MTFSPVRRALAALAALSLFVLACGDDDDADTDDPTDTTVEDGTTDETGDDGTGDDGTGDDDSAAGDLAAIPQIDVVATGEVADDGTMTHAFGPVEGATAGPARINLVNEGMAPHHVQLFKLNDGATMDDFGAALQEGVGALLGVGVFVGGTGTTDPGAESAADALVELEEGTYVMICFIEDADGVPHLAKGMVEAFEVGPAEGDVVALPAPDVTVNMADFAFDNGDLPAGGIVEVVNNADMQLHEMNLLALADGATADDVFAFFEGEAEGPPPFSGVGGVQGIMPGASQLLVVDAEPGDNYLLICNIPDPADGVPHSAKGMVLPGSVS